MSDEQAKSRSSLYRTCPHCGGSGEYTREDGNGASSSCRPCGGTGRVTDKEWKKWVDTFARAPRERRGDAPGRLKTE